VTVLSLSLDRLTFSATRAFPKFTLTMCLYDSSIRYSIKKGRNPWLQGLSSSPEKAATIITIMLSKSP